MTELTDLLEKLGVSQDDAVKAVLGAISPVQPPALRQSWCNSRRYANSAPSTKEIWRLFVDSDFRCSLCGSQRRITIDHISSDPTDHSIDNLRVLCFDCNRLGNSKATKDTDHQLRVYRAAVNLFDELGSFPTDRQVQDRAGVAQLGGTIYLLRFMRARLTATPNNSFKPRPLRGSA